MRTTTLKAIIAIVGVFATLRVHPQGAFVNLDFEQAIAPLVPDAAHTVPIASALPGWTGYVGGTQVSRVVYDTRNIDAAGISVFDSVAPQQPVQPLQGNYSAWLMGSSLFGGQQAAAIAQIGQIPAGTKSILFLFSTTYLPQLTFAGQTIPLVQLGANTSYITVGGDVSAFAGDTGELRFTALSQYTAGLLDNIEFSPVAIPEPTAMVLSLLGTAVLAWKMRRSLQVC
jgi:hypothetical protein